MNDDRFAEHLGALIREIDPPPPSPREAMWADIDAARRGGRRATRPFAQAEQAGGPTVIDPLHGGLRPANPPQRGEAKRAAATPAGATTPGAAAPPWRLRRARWAVPIAAALLVGIGIGRVFSPAEPGRTRGEARIAETPEAAAPDLPYRLVAADHLDAAEALLSALPHDTRRGDVDGVSSWAKDLLMTTRLLLDSPAADDPHMAALFQDLELVLAQIASISAAQAEDEVELIEEGIRQNHVLFRVRAATMQRAGTGI